MYDILKENLLKVLDISTNIENLHKEYWDKISKIDLLRNDILHSIELDKLSGSAMMIQYKELQAILKIRRTYKYNVQLIDSFQSVITLSKIKKGVSCLDKKIEQLGRSTYTVRINSEVKQAILNELEKDK